MTPLQTIYSKISTIMIKIIKVRSHGHKTIVKMIRFFIAAANTHKTNRGSGSEQVYDSLYNSYNKELLTWEMGSRMTDPIS